MMWSRRARSPSSRTRRATRRSRRRSRRARAACAVVPRPPVVGRGAVPRRVQGGRDLLRHGRLHRGDAPQRERPRLLLCRARARPGGRVRQLLALPERAARAEPGQRDAVPRGAADDGRPGEALVDVGVRQGGRRARAARTRSGPRTTSRSRPRPMRPRRPSTTAMWARALRRRARLLGRVRADDRRARRDVLQRDAGHAGVQLGRAVVAVRDEPRARRPRQLPRRLPAGRRRGRSARPTTRGSCARTRAR